MATPPRTPQRPLWQQLGIWVIALVVAGGLIASGNELLSDQNTNTTSEINQPPALTEEPREDASLPDPVEQVPDQVVEPESDISPETPEDTPEISTDVVTAADQLATLPIRPRASRDGYSRDEFGRAWLDADQNGCDTRNDILRRDLDDTVIDSRCRVLTGVLQDPLTGNTIYFERGEQTSAFVQIDHVVALSNAWQTGAQLISERARIEFANDPLNLIAVSGELNQQKGDSDAASWLPPDRSYWCEYVARQVGVKAHYSLWVTQAEFDQMARVLRTCPAYPALTPNEHGRFRPGEIPLP